MDGRASRRFCRDGRRSCRVSSEEETKAVAREFAKELRPGDVVCLEGDLGAGKTSFVKGIAIHFGVPEEEVTSPTFIYLQQYNHIAHFDLYRLKDESEVLALGFDEYFGEPYITCVEWPNILNQILPEEVYWISLRHSSTGREIVIEKRVK